MTEDELDQLQSYAFEWWRDYRLSLQFRVADVIHSAMGKDKLRIAEELSHASSMREEGEDDANVLQKNWISTMRSVRDTAGSLSKQNLIAVWKVEPSIVWEWAVVHDTFLAYVDANIRFLSFFALAEEVGKVRADPSSPATSTTIHDPGSVTSLRWTGEAVAQRIIP